MIMLQPNRTTYERMLAVIRKGDFQYNGKGWEGRCGRWLYAPTVSPSPCLPLYLPHCVSLPVSPTVSPSLCLPPRVSHCVSHCVSLPVSPTVSPSLCLPPRVSHCTTRTPRTCGRRPSFKDRFLPPRATPWHYDSRFVSFAAPPFHPLRERPLRGLRSGIGYAYGGETVQGMVPFFFTTKMPEGSVFTPDECVYNNMGDSPRCRSIDPAQVKVFHFTVCQVPTLTLPN
jgi:hypothetical protein